ncbi:hypothetical protein [Nonomuraea sp. bgisy101]
MREYGFAAVRDSLRAAEQFAGENAMARIGIRTFLRTAPCFPSIRRKASG